MVVFVTHGSPLCCTLPAKCSLQGGKEKPEPLEGKQSSTCWLVTLSCSCLSLQEAIGFVRGSVEEIIASTDGNLTRSLLTLLECLFQPFVPAEVRLFAAITCVHL